MSARVDETAPLVTVVVPCYNQAHYLAECLESVRAQSLDRWRAIVVDDRSPDHAQITAVVDELADARVRIVRHAKNKGLAGSRNTGIREATTPYVLPLDADDKLAPEGLELLVGALEATPAADCVYGAVRLFGRDERVVRFHGPRPGEKLVRADHTIPGAGTMMRRAFWERVGGYDEAEQLRYGREDLEFWIRSFDRGCHALRVDEPTYLYRQTHVSMSTEARRFDHVIGSYIYEKHKALLDGAGEGRRFLSSWHQKAAYARYLHREHLASFRLAWKGFRLDPGWPSGKEVIRSLLPHALERELLSGDLRRRVPFLGYPLRGRDRFRPFFLIGVGRSGNTLFRRILTSHSRLHIPPETFVLGETITKFQHYSKRMSWRELVYFTFSQFEFHPEFDTFDLWLGPLAQRVVHWPRRQRSLAHVLDAFYRYHAKVHAPEKQLLRWGDKTPMNSLDDALVRGDVPRRVGVGVPETLERLLRVFPDAQFLRIYRDGVDVVHSHLRGGFFRSVEDAATRWVHVMRQTANFAARHPGRCHEVRYEQLVGAPEHTVRGVCSFLEVDFEPAMLTSEGVAGRLGDVAAWSWHEQVGKPIDPGRVGNGRRYLTPAERETLQRIIGPELSALGYPPATDDGSGESVKEAFA